MSPISRLMSLITRRVSTISVAVSDVPGYGSRVYTYDHSWSEAPDGSPGINPIDDPLRSPYDRHDIRDYYLEHPLVLLSGTASAVYQVSLIYHINLTSPAILIQHLRCGSMYRDGGSGGSGDDGSIGDGTSGSDECVGGAVHLTRRSPAEGGDSEIGGDGDGVVMAKSLSTSASSGRDMEV
ncbi:hypothetical protein Tco_1457545 [Tanacetum coccineum]